MDIAISNDCAFAANHTAGLQVVDVFAMNTMSVVGSPGSPGPTYRITYKDGIAYLVDGNSFRSITIVMPETPALEDVLDLDCHDVALSGDRAFIAAVIDDLKKVFRANPDDLIETDSLDLSGVAVAVAVAQNHVFVASQYVEGSNEAVYIVDISPNLPRNRHRDSSKFSGRPA